MTNARQLANGRHTLLAIARALARREAIRDHIKALGLPTMTKRVGASGPCWNRR